ncbi:MAG: ABC transporter ATP-binding protein, partial [Candidatus Cloacimonetes bacterium]|nr:ABC transporter ATP-binding protein [Candidatus Cloacimonadota bacterium]
LVILALVPTMAFSSIRFQIVILRSYRRVRMPNSRITHSFGEGIHGAKTTKTLVREAANQSEFRELNQEMYHHSVKAAVRSALFMPMILALSALGTGIVVWIGGSQVLNQALGMGTLVAFIGYAMQLFEPISNVAHHFAEMQNAQAAGERVYSLLSLVPEIQSQVPMDQEWRSQRMQGQISITNLTFAYKEGKPVFQDFNLEIARGESLALAGETGTGKTTLVNLICRFYEPQSGEIRIDGQDYRCIPQEWIHSQLGYVQQTPHLFQGSILENIRYGRLDASDQEVYDAAKLVHADDFIATLPEAYNYQVGESGNLLSTGQKQLISFARVVLANPALLILDEATASIDTETELLLQKAIQTILKGRTSIIIAHRLSTIRNSDCILLLHKGKIVERGSHKALMNKKAAYYKLYMNQFRNEKTEETLAKEA